MKKEQIIGKCLLCLEEKLLLSKSHIIPSFFFERFIKQKSNSNKIVKLDLHTLQHVSSPNQCFESGILCHDCDNKTLSYYEDYSSKLLFGSLSKRTGLNFKSQNNVCLFSNVDYSKFKLFCLSLMWRVSISSLFPETKLDAYLEERIRKAVLNKELISEDDLPIEVWYYLHCNETIPMEMILSPQIREFSESEIDFCFIGGGLYIRIMLKDEGIPKMNFSLFENGELKVRLAPCDSMKNLINKMLPKPLPSKFD